ncbi:hypothetical protein Pan241w_29300 [Gimesia alba]|uniref:Uncharacterized protein n=1 Tax=Gimesia alba TaxID=2527973 RepID=A0A517RG39_9PLAN|nr:hypothetical protein [Gimesia alba]QDT42841.1 hypothetical protein Pan241w_29300 [Gimesia alba]
MNRFICCSFILFFLTIPFSARSQINSEIESAPQHTKYTNWPWPVAIPKTSSPEIISAAARLTKSLNNPLNVLQVTQNPGCALWLEVGSWKPNPSTPGYLILIQPGGGRIIASNLEQLQLAIHQLKQKTRIHDGKTELPVGVITNYSLIGKANARS